MPITDNWRNALILHDYLHFLKSITIHHDTVFKMHGINYGSESVTQ